MFHSGTAAPDFNMGAVRYTDASFWENDGEAPQAITDGRI